MCGSDRGVEGMVFLVGMCKFYIDSSSIIVWETLAGALALSWGNLHFSFFLFLLIDGRKVCAWCLLLTG